MVKILHYTLSPYTLSSQMRLRYPVISFHGQIVPQNSHKKQSKFFLICWVNFIEKKNVSFLLQTYKISK